MQHQIRRLTAVIAVALIALMLNLANLQVFQADSLRLRQDNTRLLLEEYGRQRGSILIGNTVIAQSIQTGGALQYERRYTDGPLYATVTGFYSLVYGATGLERIYNDILSGSDDRLAVDRLQQLLAGKSPQGGAVTLTLDMKTQKAAFNALNGRRGAVVAIDPATGEILALVASPSFDPNSLSRNKPEDIRLAYEALLNDPEQPLANRPLTTSLPPGSTFKLVVAAAAIESGKFKADSVIPGPATLKLPNSTKELHNWQNAPCSKSGKLTLARALEVSCNTAFAWLGMQVGADQLRLTAEKFGFNSSIETPLVSASSVFPAGIDEAQLAMSSIGQFDVRSTALQMAMVVAALANDGVLMQPHFVKDLRNQDLKILETIDPQIRQQTLSKATAQALLTMMVGVVESGTATSGRINGVTVGAKTGTAQSGTDAKSHAWFVANGQKGSRQISVAVVVENGGGAVEVSGNRIAGPVAAAVIKAYLK